ARTRNRPLSLASVLRISLRAARDASESLTRVGAVRSNRLMSRKTAIVLFGGLTTAGSALGILIACLAEGGDWLGFAVPGVGIVLLLGVALLGHYSETVS